ncbi:MAG: hypothetical protein HY744_03870 [Deltaproteobacteria bacterium]|nr:hypothetical protein [Deltaproteobacteria bacterium]
MATNPILGRDVYLALAAVGWADGQLTPAAADAIVRTALEEGLSFEQVAEIEEATKHPKPIGDVDRWEMSKADRLYVYAVASWIAALDGNVTEKEKEALAKLGDGLGVPERPREHADAIMREIAERGDRPERFDLIALRRTLDERLDVARSVRLEQRKGERDAERARKKAEREAAKQAKH